MMVGGILFLAVAIFGISVLFGKGKLENYYHFLIWLIIAPLLISVGFNYVLWLWDGLPLWAQIILFLFVPFLISALLRIMFPKARWLDNLQAAIFQTLIYIVTFPLRLLWRAGQFFFQQERRPQRLNPYRPVIGGRPPFQNERQQASQRGNIFD